MKKLTENQQSIIDSISKEFERINASVKPKGKFNLVDVSEMNAINEEIRINKEVAKADDTMWNSIAMEEARRVVELLKEDFPDWVYVGVFGDENGREERSAIAIQKKSGLCPNEKSVKFYIDIKKEEVKQSHGCRYYKGIGLSYGYYNYSDYYRTYDTLEDLFEKSRIKENIRTIILNK